jgi:transposase
VCAIHRFVEKEMAMGSVAHLEAVRITVGVDTHRDEHVAVALDALGKKVATTSMPTTPRGYRDLLAWAEGLGAVEAWGVEGTGSYGAGLARHLKSAEQLVHEVIRPNRSLRRRKGKSDPIDAEAAARAVQAGVAAGVPKSGEGAVEMIRILRVARSSAVKQRTQSINNMRGLIVTAPAELREALRGLSVPRLVAACCLLRPGELATPTAAVKFALRGLARRLRDLTEEIKALDAELAPLTLKASPRLTRLFGVGTEVAGQLLVTAGDNPGRLHSEESFAALCGVSPVEASSGQTRRHRLNRGGDRQANAALYRIVIVRLRHDEETGRYMAKRTAEGKSKREVIRCLKRYIANEVYAALMSPPAEPQEAA